MRWTAIVLAAAAFLAACGDEETESPVAAAPTATTAAPAETATPAATAREQAPAEGTEIVLGDSRFGTMLFDTRKQAIYIFEKDSDGETVCYDECAEAWPPVYTDGEPVAGKGVKASLLGTIERKDGKRQVTYAGKPLYFYAHEGPGEVLCHNVNLNGGLWWVVAPDGKRRA